MSFMGMEQIAPALEMTTQGMSGIFVVLGTIAFMVWALKKLDNRK
jgi:flagellar biogenesis protein FliO